MDVRKPWREWHRPLMVGVALWAGLVVVSIVGLLLDHRTLLDESVWVKPLKFGVAFGLYGAVLAWLLTRLRKARRFGWWVGTVFAASALVEVGAITVQAARGTFSHFNADTDPVTVLVTTILTDGVAVLVIAQLLIAGLVLAQRTGDRALDLALKVGLPLSTVGMLVPVFWLVTNISPRQVTDANGVAVQMYQGHGIGDPDGHGMAITNWSATGGDFRVPHFVGLHSVHVLLLVTWLLTVLATRYGWLRAERVRARLVGVAALGYGGLFAVVTWQAARGQSLIHPDGRTLVAFAAVVLVTVLAAVAVVLAARRGTTAEHPDLVSAAVD
jgi:hypothetical protein